VGEVAQKIHPNVLMVIAGRKLPDWNRVWSAWMMNAQVEELKPMTEDIMRELIHRYYATMRGGIPDPAQVDAIIRFARGLPMVVTSAVQLWVKYGVEDFQSVKAEIVANLVDRLMEGVPSNLIPALEAAAAVRWFDQPILRAVTEQEDVRDVYNELRRFPFVRSRSEGLALHDSVREMMDENLRVQDSERHAELHERAAAYFEKRLEKATGEEAERLGLERLYHRVRADEETGIKLFQKMAEELALYRLLNRLRVLLNDISTYHVAQESNKLWREYYGARLDHLESRLDKAESVYRSIGENARLDPKLRAYSLCGLGIILSSWQNLGERDERVKEAVDILQLSLKLIPIDSYTVESLASLAHICKYEGKWGQAYEYEKKSLQYFKDCSDQYGLITSYAKIKLLHAGRGEWKEMIETHRVGFQLALELNPHSFSRADFMSSAAWAWAWIGRLAEAERDVRDGLQIVLDLGVPHLIWRCHLYLGLILAMQNRFDEGVQYLSEAQEKAKSFGEKYLQNVSDCQGFWGVLLIKQGKWNDAKEKLSDCLVIRKKLQISPNISEALIWQGQLDEAQHNWGDASQLYNQSLDTRQFGRRNFEVSALTGLIRVKHAQGDIAAIPPLLAEAEQLAQQYEYNDHLASLRLTQGHLRTETSEVSQTSEVWMSMNALDYYKQAMIYALRYNRFLLDELLSGRPQGTPLRPIIPYCLKRGEEGKKILSALHDWWKTGVNDVGTPRPDTISPIPEGIPLLEAEKIAREREPGDGSMQRSVVEQIETAIGK
jgi:ATP/maltotriose-dependent transcriptional regulator MalT